MLEFKPVMDTWGDFAQAIEFLSIPEQLRILRWSFNLPLITGHSTSHIRWELIPGGSKPNFLAIRMERELISTKIVHVATDGGARRNPGAAGLVA
jgi:hypothetical protein